TRGHARSERAAAGPAYTSTTTTSGRRGHVGEPGVHPRSKLAFGPGATFSGAPKVRQRPSIERSRSSVVAGRLWGEGGKGEWTDRGTFVALHRLRDVAAGARRSRRDRRRRSHDDVRRQEGSGLG